MLGDRSQAPLRIGIVFPGDSSDKRTWSGTPSGVARGLEEAGAEVTHISASPESLLQHVISWPVALGYLPRAGSGPVIQRARRAGRAAMISPALTRVRARVVRGRLAGLACDGYVQIGASFPLRAAAPVVTYEDMTVAQALEYPYDHWQTLRARDVTRRMEGQRSAYQAARACCLTNSWARRSVIRDYGISAAKAHVVGVGTNQEPRRVERDWSVPRFLFVGREWERKNGPAVVRAFARLRREFADAELHVVGGHPPLAADGVTGHGALRQDVAADRAHLKSLYDGATCFVMPSLFEPSAVVYTEAAAAGIPSVGTVIGGSRDIVGDGGISVDPHSDAAIYEAMLRLSDPAVARDHARRALARSELFVWRKVAERLLRALEVPGWTGLADFLPTEPQS